MRARARQSRRMHRAAPRPTALLQVMGLILVMGFVIGFETPVGSAGEGKEEAGGGLVAYKASRIVPVAGPVLSPGVLLVRGGKIEAVLPGGAEIPAGARIIELEGLTILPGLVNPLSRIHEAARGRRGSAAGSGPSSPVDVRRRLGLSAVDLRNPVFRRIARTGYTAVAIVPAAGLLGGTASAIRPARGGEKEAKELALLESGYLYIGFGLGKAFYESALARFKKAAEAVLKEREEAKKNAGKKEGESKGGATGEKKQADGKEGQEGGASDKGGGQKAPQAEDSSKTSRPPRPDPLVEVFRGERKAFVHVTSPAALEHWWRLYDELPLGFRFVLVTSALPPDIVERVAQRRDRIEAVVLDPGMGRLWETSIFVNTARLFLEKGFDVALVPPRDDPDGFAGVFFHTAELVRTGVEEYEALRALTLVPARLLGLEGRVGALLPGARADFALYRGDPLSGHARLEAVYVEGREIYRLETCLETAEEGS